MFPDYFFMMRDAIRLRYTLAPYIYNAARQNYDTGVGICRPMYYDSPEREEAYSARGEYMFGDDILATAVTEPVDSITGLARCTVWFPEGQWYDCATGAMHAGNRRDTLLYTLAENPWFARAGAILPMNPSSVRNLQQRCDTLVLEFIPGADGELDYYEDDGFSTAYEEGASASTHIVKRQNERGIRVLIGARRGSYDGASARRSYELRFPAQFPPVKVRLNGRELPYARFPEAGTWSYDPYTLAPVIHTGRRSCSEPLDIELLFDTYALAHQKELYGKSGIFKRCLALTVEFKAEQSRQEPYLMLPAEYLTVSQAPNFIVEEPTQAAEHLRAYERDKALLLERVDSLPYIGEAFRQRLKAQLSDIE